MALLPGRASPPSPELGGVADRPLPTPPRRSAKPGPRVPAAEKERVPDIFGTVPKTGGRRGSRLLSRHHRNGPQKVLHPGYPPPGAGHGRDRTAFHVPADKNAKGSAFPLLRCILRISRRAPG